MLFIEYYIEGSVICNNRKKVNRVFLESSKYSIL